MIHAILTTAAVVTALGADARFEAMSEAYRAEITAERVTVRYTDRSGTTAETITVRVKPEWGAVVEFGGLRAFVSRHVLVVIPENDRKRAFVAPVGGDISGALATHLPGVPAWQVAAALDGPESIARMWPLSAAVSPPLIIAGDDGRLRFASVDLGEGRGVRLSVEAVDAGDTEDWMIDLSGRRRVGNVAALTAKTPLAHTERVRVGDDAPTLLMLSLDMRPWVLSARDAGAAAIVLCRSQTAGVAAGYGAALDVAEDPEAPLGFTPVLGVCGEPFAGAAIDHLDELRRRWGDGAKWTVSQETTIDRFAPDAEAVLVLIDAFDSVRAIIPLDGRGGDQAELAGEIRAALRGE